jgi:hypothetical protein
MRLTDLNARFLNAGGVAADGTPMPTRIGVGVIFACPCGDATSECYVPFANPLDGGPQYGPQGWQRTGDTMEMLTLTPSVLRTYSACGCQWHGFVTNGEVLSV